mgnify:CR=1 FL=1
MRDRAFSFPTFDSDRFNKSKHAKRVKRNKKKCFAREIRKDDDDIDDDDVERARKRSHLGREDY